MARTVGRRKRQRGAIEQLPSGALRVKVYAGIDPVTKARRYLSEMIPAGKRAAAEAEKVLTRLLAQVDERRNPRTSATVNQLLDRWLEVLDVETTTRRNYVAKVNKHIRPILGSTQVGRIDAEVLEALYADLRKCRDHCRGRRYTQHRTTHEHTCDEHPAEPCSQPDPSCAHCRRRCKPHMCKSLSDSAIRGVHWILSSAFQRAVRWNWTAINPADSAEPPRLPVPDPRPPSSQNAARIVDEAGRRDPDWGAFVWMAMTTGARRSELCALRWSDVDLDTSLVTLRRALYLDDNRELREKDTKTHQQRRVVLDQETLAVLREHHTRVKSRVDALGIELPRDGYVFSIAPDGSAPLRPDSVSQRYDRMAARLGIETTLHKLRHYSATELINAGVDIRTVAGRLGHGGGGATTLRVYTAWTAEADQRAASTLSARMPSRSRSAEEPNAPSEADQHRRAGSSTSNTPHEQIAADLRGAIACGALQRGTHLPPIKVLAERYGVASSTAQRAVSQLAASGLVRVARGRRATVS